MLKLARYLFRTRNRAPVHNFIKNGDIIFDHVRVVDRYGNALGEMRTPAAIQLAKSQGLELFLINYGSEPPVCQMTNESSLTRDQTEIAETKGFSFDPTLRPATIIFSSNIADQELDRKVDVLRKHLLEKKRCEVHITHDEQVVEDVDAKRVLLGRILSEVEDIAKPLISDTNIDNSSELRVSVWPCNPEQTGGFRSSQLKIGEVNEAEDHQLSLKGHERKFRRVRPTTDPKIANLDRRKPSFREDE